MATNGKTIKQIADEIGVSKQAIFYRIKKPPLSNALQPFTSKFDGVLTVSFDGEILIKSAFNHNKGVKEPSNFDVKENQSFDALYTMFQRELDAKNEQLREKDEQLKARDRQLENLTAALEHTTESLHAAQALHAGTIQKQLTDGGGDPAEPNPPRGIIARLFKKKRSNEKQ